VFEPGRATTAFIGQFTAAARTAYGQFERLVGPRYGVAWRDTYVLSDGTASGFAVRSAEDDLVGDIRPAPRTLRPEEHPFGGLDATLIRTLHIEPTVFLDALLTDVCDAGGRIVTRALRDLRDLMSLPEALILNCTGLGAGLLVGDDEMLPIKGQLAVLSPQPDVDYLTIGPGDLYMMPRRDGIVLGGTHERGVWSLDPDPREADRIVEGHRTLFARMAV
jgi:hypothetical protein